MIVLALALNAIFPPLGFDAACEQARASGKLVLVDVYATWCGPCHEMDDKVWPRDDVQHALTSGYVPLRQDGEAEGAKLVARYHVVGFPTVLVIDPKSGEEVDRLMGFVPPAELVTQLARFREGKGTLADLERRLAATPPCLDHKTGCEDEGTLRLEVGTRHAMRGDARAVVELTQVVSADPDNLAHRAAPALSTLGKYYYLRGLKDYAHAEATLRELVRRFPQTDEAQQAPYNLAIALKGLGRATEARALLDRWVAEAPQAERGERVNAYAWLSVKNGFDRARGIEVAKAGVAADPKDHALWDTLAEIYALAGKLPEARDAEQHALGVRPKDTYYEAQLRRFGGTP